MFGTNESIKYTQELKHKVMIAYARLKSLNPDITDTEASRGIEKCLKIKIKQSSLTNIVRTHNDEINKKITEYKCGNTYNSMQSVRHPKKYKLPQIEIDISSEKDKQQFESLLALLEEVPLISYRAAEARLGFDFTKIANFMNKGDKKRIEEAMEIGKLKEEVEVLTAISSYQTKPSDESPTSKNNKRKKSQELQENSIFSASVKKQKFVGKVIQFDEAKHKDWDGMRDAMANEWFKM